MFLGDDTSYRTRLTLVRGTVVQHDDSPMMQTVSFRGLQNEMLTAERFQSYGRSTVPVAPDDTAGLKAPEMIAGFIGGDRSHPVVWAMDDRRYRPKGGNPGDVVDYHFKGYSATWGSTGWAYTGGSAKLPASWTIGNLVVTYADGKATVQIGGSKGIALIVKPDAVYAGGDPDVIGAGAFMPVMTTGGPSNKMKALPG